MVVMRLINFFNSNSWNPNSDEVEMIFRHTIISTGDELSDCRQKRPSSACFLFLYKPGCGFSLAPLIFSTELFSWTFLAYSLLTFFITALIVFLLFPTARETFLASSATARRTVIISSFLLSLLLLFNMPLQPFHAISAMVRLAIYGAVGFDSGIGSIEFLYLGDSLGYIPYKDLVITKFMRILSVSTRKRHSVFIGKVDWEICWNSLSNLHQLYTRLKSLSTSKSKSWIYSVGRLG